MGVIPSGTTKSLKTIHYKHHSRLFFATGLLHPEWIDHFESFENVPRLKHPEASIISSHWMCWRWQANRAVSFERKITHGQAPQAPQSQEIKRKAHTHNKVHQYLQGVVHGYPATLFSRMLDIPCGGPGVRHWPIKPQRCVKYLQAPTFGLCITGPHLRKKMTTGTHRAKY